MSTGRFPGPYVRDVPSEGADKMMEYTLLERMDIGARSSGKPKDNKGPNSLEHVGGTSGGKK